MTSIPSQCQALADELLQLRQEQARLVVELQQGNIIGAILALLAKNEAIDAKARELDACLGNPPSLTCTLSGRMFFDIGAKPEAGLATPVSVFNFPFPPATLTFSGPNYSRVEFRLPGVSRTIGPGTTDMGRTPQAGWSIFGQDIGPVVDCPYSVTISGAGIGSFDIQLGEVDIPLSLQFTPSPAWLVQPGWLGGIRYAACSSLIAGGASTLVGTLTTRSVLVTLRPEVLDGQALLRPDGGIFFIMTGVFSGGFLDGTGCDLFIGGGLSKPLP
jgi:hypothetical protein